ncbi:DUF5110 domain-containing protein [Streptomyces fagopyri]|uniref:DUF5110 domain-containing protein n=1 Tax=Streptomyces fagopyri TaxID=2662397 RepID=UPI00369C9307
MFIKAGGMMPTRTHDVAHDDQNALTDVTLTVAAGGSGSSRLYEDDATATGRGASAATLVRYKETGDRHTVTISPTKGSFRGQVPDRRWTLLIMGASRPARVTPTGVHLSPHAYHWDEAAGVLTVTLPRHTVHAPITVTYR